MLLHLITCNYTWKYDISRHYAATEILSETYQVYVNVKLAKELFSRLQVQLSTEEDPVPKTWFELPVKWKGSRSVLVTEFIRNLLNFNIDFKTSRVAPD